MTITRDDAWVYARRSRKSDDLASVEAQIDRALDEITDHGWRHAGTLNEEVSASPFAKKQREAWPQLLESVRAGKVGIVVLWESNRGDRTLTSWSEFLDLCKDTGTRIYVITHQHLYDLRVNRDWKALASDGVENQDFSLKLSNDVKRGKRAAMKKGRPSGQTPYGYRVKYSERTGKPAGWEVIPERAAVVLEIKRRTGKSEPVMEIMRDLDARGIPGPTGGTWNTRSIRHIARNPAYAGLVDLGDGTYAERQPQKDGAEWPAICEREEHDAAVAALDGRALGHRLGEVKHLMSNLADCECGEVITSRGKGIYACMTGHMSVRCAWLDEIVSYRVKNRLRKPDARQVFAVDTGERVATLKLELAALENRRKKYIAAAAAGDEDADDILAELRPRIEAKRRELAAVTVVPALKDLLDADDIDAAWESLTLQARRAAIAAVTGVMVRRVPKHPTKAVRDDVERVVLDWQPQRRRKGPRGRTFDPTRG